MPPIPTLLLKQASFNVIKLFVIILPDTSKFLWKLTSPFTYRFSDMSALPFTNKLFVELSPTTSKFSKICKSLLKLTSLKTDNEPPIDEFKFIDASSNTTVFKFILSLTNTLPYNSIFFVGPTTSCILFKLDSITKLLLLSSDDDSFIYSISNLNLLSVLLNCSLDGSFSLSSLYKFILSLLMS